jgi:hypothetical protein
LPPARFQARILREATADCFRREESGKELVTSVEIFIRMAGIEAPIDTKLCAKCGNENEA